MGECIYVVRVSFVDDTYWDDGSRWTSQVFEFSKRKYAVAFAQEALSKGCRCKGQCGEVLVRPDRRDITVERKATTAVKWPAHGDSER